MGETTLRHHVTTSEKLLMGNQTKSKSLCRNYVRVVSLFALSSLTKTDDEIIVSETRGNRLEIAFLVGIVARA